MFGSDQVVSTVAQELAQFPPSFFIHHFKTITLTTSSDTDFRAGVRDG
ncbi:hypothetical protein GCM10025779_30710 [Arthrobacter cryoconiti]